MKKPVALLLGLAALGVAGAETAAAQGLYYYGPGGFYGQRYYMVRKNGRMVSPETVASSSTKAAKSISVISWLPSAPPSAAVRRSAGPENAYAISRMYPITI